MKAENYLIRLRNNQVQNFLDLVSYSKIFNTNIGLTLLSAVSFFNSPRNSICLIAFRSASNSLKSIAINL